MTGHTTSRHLLCSAALLIASLAWPVSVQAQDTAPTPPSVQTDMAAPEAPVADQAPAFAPVADTALSVAPAVTPPAATGATTAPAPTPAPPVFTMPHDMSPMGMFRAAHWVVQAVMLSLLLACFLTWTVLLFKIIEMFVAGLRLRRSSRIIRSGVALPAVAQALGKHGDPASFMAQAALEEMHRSDAALDAAGTSGLKERVRSILDRIEVQAGKRLRRGTGILATIGSTAPFVGLFGTVWGIMNSFISIAETKSTNLAVVAPGIAEALLATAIGLVAAIPAVVIYNHFARTIANYRVTLGDAGAGVERLVSRDLDFRAAGLPARG